MVYQWKAGAEKAIPPQRVGERLEQLRRENEGELAPRDVVVDARQPESPLHRLFEWDDRKAAFEYRLGQARDVIRSVVVVTRGAPGAAPEPVRAFVCVRRDGDGEQAFGAPPVPAPQADVAKSEILRSGAPALAETAAPAARAKAPAPELAWSPSRGTVVERARRELEAWREKYGHYTELAEAASVVDDALERLSAVASGAAA